MHTITEGRLSTGHDGGQRNSRSARCASAMATAACACARRQAADTAAPLLDGCCLAEATAPLAVLPLPLLLPLPTILGHLLRAAVALVALLRAYAHDKLRTGQ